MDFYRGKCQQHEDELKEIMKQAGRKEIPNDIWGYFKPLKSRSFLKPFLCVGGLYALIELSGINLISHTYTHIFLEEREINNELISHFDIHHPIYLIS